MQHANDGAGSGALSADQGNTSATLPGGQSVFGAALLTSADAASLAELPDAVVAAHAEAAFRFIAARPAGRHHIASRSIDVPGGGGSRRLSVIEIANDDMPFLLDSVLAEVQARAIEIKLVLHPIFKVSRDRDGRLLSVDAAGDRNWGDGRQESYISIHMRELGAAEAADLAEAIAGILGQVRFAVGDWKAMLARIARAASDLAGAPAHVPADLRDEAIAFLEWLKAGNFTLLGMREYRLDGDPLTGELVPVDGGGLGVLRDPTMQVLRRGSELVALTPEVRRFFFAPNPLIITKANVIARVHRRVHMDYIGVKLYGPGGTPAGEMRVVGLFTSTAYTQSPRAIPILRRKVAAVIAADGAPPESHAGKALINVLETFPRDELFQIGRDDLERWVKGILDLEIRPRVRVFTRSDRFDRFVSVLAYVPRERYSSAVRERIGAFLAERFAGTVSAFYPSFGEAGLARVHFIIGRREGKTPVVAEADLERGIAAIATTWDDRLKEALAAGGAGAEALAHRYGHAFSAGYADAYPVARALEDIVRIERLSASRPLSIDFYSRADDPPAQVHAAIYRLDQPVSLSERVPVLENLGFTVIDERTHRIRPELAGGRRDVILHDMLLETADRRPFTVGTSDAREVLLEETFLAVANGRAESDGFNRLVIAMGATWREVAMIRAYAAYLRQLGSAFGVRYVSDTLVRHAAIAREILALFIARFDPDLGPAGDARAATESEIRERIETALAGVESLDEDRFLRQIVTLVRATQRTNFFQRTAAGEPPETIAFKLSGRDLDMAPDPKSFREIWVSSPRVDAVHLRFAPIARGGIRWSDRPLDFRTEVLGLAKAQQVKNAVIVPAGAKGGFFPKLLPRPGTREEIQREGTEAYKIFVSAMLDITDDIRDGTIVPPPRVVRHDGDDPYLVVAADKGTATFSDTANAISAGRGFWLGDAFASGGSAGYDHKGIAITSRGAWECVKRHFREMDVDIQATPFRVVGVGDMSGDVFGNGMLRSDKTCLVAAFDHRDIFIDPAPDAARSFAERQRLFGLPRSSWADYDRSLISAGGGVFPRSSKSIALSPEAKALLGLTAAAATPAEVMRAILSAEVDLLFFGGIGTYVRAATETDADVGDRANDVIRITGADLRVKVIGEGANLGMTQRGRIEAAQRGVRLNTDFIDNSAGVNCSDQEVNIKIALGPVMRSGRLALTARNELLKEMTPDVAAAVLRNNYQQSLSISLAERRTVGDLAANASLIRALEARGLLDRRLEAIPSDREIAERQRNGRGLVRPELAILSSYAKIALLHDLLAGPVPDDPGLEPLLVDYFPPALQRAYAGDLAAHRLRREIIATTLTNGLVNRLGAPMPRLLAEETSQPIGNVARAFMAARQVFGLTEIWREIDILDGRVGGEAQLDLYERVRDFVLEQTRTFLRSGIAVEPAAVGRLVAIARGLDAAADGPADRRADGAAGGVEARLGTLDRQRHAALVWRIAGDTGADDRDVAAAVRAVAAYLGTSALAARLTSLRVADEYDRRAMRHAVETIDDTMAGLARAAAQSKGGLATWVEANRLQLERGRSQIAALLAAEAWTASRLVVTAMTVRDQLAGRAGP